MKGLKGKAALVTGGSRGIGSAIACRMAREGANVAFTYLNSPEQANEVVATIQAFGGRALALRADSGDAGELTGAVERTVDEFERLDILVNNAGTFPIGPLEEVTSEAVDRTLAVHAKAAFLGAQAAARHMGDGGRIINIGSCLAERVPYPGVTLYSMSKAALLGLTRGLARDLGPRGITAILVHPGSTDTDMNPADGPGADAERQYIALGRYAVPDEVAEVVTFLAGDGGRYVTGTSVFVDGGFAA